MDKNSNNIPKVSVIIPTYNRYELLCQAIDSVLAQTYPSIEIIVVDDASVDNTNNLLNKYGSKIHYIRKDVRVGMASATRNLGIQFATGQYIGFLDDDDLWLATKIEKEVRYLEQNPQLAFVFCAASIIDQEGKIFAQKFDHEPKNLNYSRLYQGNIIWSPSLALVRKKCLDEVGGFDEHVLHSSDYDLWLRLSKRYPFGYLNEILAKYRQHVTGLSRNLDMRIKGHKIIFNKLEIRQGKTWAEKQLRIAHSYYKVATLYYEQGNYKKAGFHYLGAVVNHPLIGLYYWSRFAKKFRFSFWYRILRVYLLIIFCFLKHFMHKVGMLFFRFNKPIEIL